MRVMDYFILLSSRLPFGFLRNFVSVLCARESLIAERHNIQWGRTEISAQRNADNS